MNPFNRHVFTEADSLCNYVTDRPPAGTMNDPPAKTHDYIVPSESTNVSLPHTEEETAQIMQKSVSLQKLGPNQAFLLPEDFRGYPKAGE